MAWDRRTEILLTMLAEVVDDPHCLRAMINRALRRAERESEGPPCDGWPRLKAKIREAARLRSKALAMDTITEASKLLSREGTCPHAVVEFAFLAAALARLHEPERRRRKR